MHDVNYGVLGDGALNFLSSTERTPLERGSMKQMWLGYGIALLAIGALGCIPESNGGKSSDGDDAALGAGGAGGGGSADDAASRDVLMGPGGAMALDTGGGGAVMPGDSATDSGGSAAKTVVITTSMGAITLVLNASDAPISVANFLRYVDDGFYDGSDGRGVTTFHRVIRGFMIQGGGITPDGQLKPTLPPIRHEGNTGANTRGTVAMARTNLPDTATSQFFINHVDNPPLNYVSAGQPGYVVFGRVTAGMEVVDAIAAVATGAQDVPLMPITIDEVTRGF